MNENSYIIVNGAGGIFDNGRSFSKTKWYEIVLTFEKILNVKGRCTVRMLAAGAKISLASAKKSNNLLRYRYDNTSNIETGAFQAWGRFAQWYVDAASHVHSQIVSR